MPSFYPAGVADEPSAKCSRSRVVALVGERRARIVPFGTRRCAPRELLEGVAGFGKPAAPRGIVSALPSASASASRRRPSIAGR